jgi:hypothetical protein
MEKFDHLQSKLFWYENLIDKHIDGKFTIIFEIIIFDSNLILLIILRTNNRRIR